MSTESPHCFCTSGGEMISKQKPFLESTEVELLNSQYAIQGREQSKIQQSGETIQFDHVYEVIRSVLFLEMRWLVNKSRCILYFRRV